MAGIGQGVGSIAGSALASLIPGAGPLFSQAGGVAGGWAGGALEDLLMRQNGPQGQPGQQQGGFFQGNPGGFEQVSPYTQPQQKLFGQLGQHAWNQLQNPSAGFAPIRQNALMNFQNKTLPSLAERFTASTNAKIGSPAFTSQAELASGDLEAQLAALEAQYGMQNQNQALQMLQLGLQPQYQNQYMEPQGGFNQGIGQFLQLLAPTLGKAGIQGLAGYMGGQPNLSKGQQDFWNAISFSNTLNGMKGS